MIDSRPQLIPLPTSKRFFDIVFSLLFIILSLPLTVFILLSMLIEQIFYPTARGSFFYSELRISQGRPFKFYKWRIFKTSALEEAKRRDGYIETARVQGEKSNLTYCGRVLKRVYLDEMPQFWNILKGDMTLVGPRPTNLRNSDIFRLNGDFTREIMVCGLTGPYQCRKGYGFNQKLCDQEYVDFIKNHSGWRIIFKDIGIIFKTIVVMLKAKGI